MLKDNEKIWLLHIGTIYSYWITKYHIPIRRASVSEVVDYCEKNRLNVTLKPL